MQSRRGSFHWSEDLDEALNYWFWLRGGDEIDDQRLIDEVALSVHREPLDAHYRVAGDVRWPEFLLVGQEWKRRQVVVQIDESRSTPPALGRAHYQVVAGVGLSSLRVYWVMAPIGERWLFPPSVAVLGVDGASPDQRRRAVVEAAKALHPN